MDSSTVAYRYDKIGQLKVADSSVAAEDRGYAFDAAWNLNYRTNNGSATTYSVDSRNRLTSVASTPDYYDVNGNLVQVGNSNGTYVTYLYDDENRLTEVATNYSNGQQSLAGAGPASPSAGLWKSDFVYDGLGRLRERLDYSGGTLQTTTLYVYDGWRVIQERNQSSTPTVSYTRGNDLSGSLEGAGGIGGLLARSHGYSGGNWSAHNVYHADGNGNVTSMLNSSQTLVASYRYDPFGNTSSSSGSLATANTYRFSSKEIHVSSGMYYYGYRFYDSGLQRWINRDPIEEVGGANLYTFLLNAPLDYVDTDGRGIWTDPDGGRWPTRPRPPADPVPQPRPSPAPKRPPQPNQRPPTSPTNCLWIPGTMNGNYGGYANPFGTPWATNFPKDSSHNYIPVLIPLPKPPNTNPPPISPR
jgi:RHS repeat-associated protein